MDIGDIQTIRVRLSDMGPVGGPHTEVKVCISPAAISLYPESIERKGGVNPPILLYLYGGILRLFVWSDPDSEQPTHTVCFDGARPFSAMTPKPPQMDGWELE